MSNEIKKTIKDVRDAVKEGVHRGNAEAEHDLRRDAGDLMTPSEKLGSVARETGETAKADIDRAKRNVRDAT